MSRVWLALARYSAKRAGGRFVRSLEIEHASTPVWTAVSHPLHVTWRWS